MNKYDFTKGILDQLGQPLSRNEHRNENESSGVQQEKWRDVAAQPKASGRSEVNLLAVFTGTNVGLEKALEELRKSRKYGISFDIAFSWNGKDLLDIKHIQKQLGARNIFTEVDKGKIGPIIERIDGIVVPMTTQNTTAKLSQGILDDFISTLLWESLWRGKKMIMNMESVVAYKGQRSKVPKLQKMVEDRIEIVKEMGVITFYGKDYQKVLQEAFCEKGPRKSSYPRTESSVQTQIQQPDRTGEKTIITEKDIINLNSPLGVLTVPYDAIITPLAYDRGKAMGIEIKKEQG